MDPSPWYREGIALMGLAVAGIIGWFVRFVMGQNRRIADLETSMAVMNTHLGNIEKNIERGVSAIERMETRHREDIIRAYEHIEQLHVVVIQHLADAATVMRREDT